MDDKKEMFKEFVRNNDFLIGYVKRGEKTWQELYQLYDLYGEDEDIWNKYLSDDSNKNDSNNYFKEIVNMCRNIDVNKVQEGITSLQKTLGLFGDLFINKDSNNSSKNNYNPRPLYRRFED